MQLTRRTSQGQLISLVPMIDVMLILLVFFMVTSTYLNLDMIPMVERSEDAPAAQASGAEATTVLVRIGSDGQTYLQGRSLGPEGLGAAIAARLDTNPLLSIVLLPSSQARTQDLVSAMDVLTRAGAERIRLMRLEAGR